MTPITHEPQLPWLQPGQPFPPVQQAWGPSTGVSGLLAAGADLEPPTLQAAYRQGIFPWYSEGQPILWWSPDPRMVLPPDRFRMHRSLRKSLQRFLCDDRNEIRFDTAFEQVIRRCSGTRRRHQSGTWITEDMIQAYLRLHAIGVAHSVETWLDGELVAGLYGLSIGRALFGESMFTQVSDGSKWALSALVAFALEHGIEMIDCQQNTAHLASLGGQEIPRPAFSAWLARATTEPTPQWQFNSVYWKHVSRLG